MNVVLDAKKILTSALIIVLILLICPGQTIFQNYNLTLGYVAIALTAGLFLCKEDKMIKVKYMNPFVVCMAIYLIFDYFIINSNGYLSKIRYYLIIWVVALILLADLGEEIFDVFMKGVYYFATLELITVFLELVTGHRIWLFLQRFYSSTVYNSILIQATKGYYVGIVGEKAYAAFWLVLGLAMFLAKNIKKDLPINPKTIIGTALYLFAIFLTAKRTIIVIALVLVASQLLLVNYSKKSITLFVVIIVAMIGFYFVYMYVPAVQLMLLRFSNTAEDLETMNSRADLWDFAKDMFRAKPLFGWGRGSYHLLSPTGFEAHNIFLQNFAENGLFGGILWFLIYISGLFSCVVMYFKTREEQTKILMLSQMLIMVYGFTENIMFIASVVGYYFMTFVGLYYIYKKYRNLNHEE